MKLSSSLSLFLATATSALACEISPPTTIATQEFKLKTDSELTDDDFHETHAGDVTVSVSGTTLSVTYQTISYWSVFNTQVFVGGSIEEIPKIDGNADETKFNYVSEEYNPGLNTVTVEVDISNVKMQCIDGEAKLAIMPHAKVGEICDHPEEQDPPVAWLLETDFPASAGPNDLGPDYYIEIPVACECPEEPEDPRLLPAPPKDPATGSGDPHFKTWTGDKFDYHGECDLVLVDNPSFDDGKGLKVHIRTTRIKYFSYIERIAIQIGSDVLEFANDVEKFTINGKPVEEQRVHHKTHLDRFVVRRDKKALSIRLTDRKQNGPKIDLIQRNIGWPAVIVDGGDTDIFAGSLGLLGQWETGKKIARDGNTEMNKEDATDYALEWQVRDTEPMLFSEARFPQFPTQCTPPAKVLGNRLGMKRAREEAAKACAGWKHDQDDCIFDVMATRDFSVAAEGSITAA